MFRKPAVNVFWFEIWAKAQINNTPVCQEPLSAGWKKMLPISAGSFEKRNEPVNVWDSHALNIKTRLIPKGNV